MHADRFVYTLWRFYGTPSGWGAGDRGAKPVSRPPEPAGTDTARGKSPKSGSTWTGSLSSPSWVGRTQAGFNGCSSTDCEDESLAVDA